MSNETALLNSLVTGQTINSEFQPQNNKQAYLAYLNGLDIALPDLRSAEEVLLYNLCVNGGAGGSTSSELDFSDGSFEREGALQLFRSLKTKPGKIILTGNPCITGEVVLAAGNYVSVNSYDEVCALFGDIALDTEVAIQVNNESIRSYPSLEDALMLLERETYPMMISWREIRYAVDTLTDEDRAIATDKGWTIVEG